MAGQRKKSAGKRSAKPLGKRAKALLGAERGRAVRLMATLPQTTSDGDGRIRELLAAGMDCLRLDAARGDRAGWHNALERLRRAGGELRRPCKLMVQLPAPALATGELSVGPAVLRWEPRRNLLGRLLRPARIWITAADRADPPLQPVDVTLPVEGRLLERAQTEDKIRFKDARGRRREIRIRGAGRSGCLAEADQTTYVEPGGVLRLERRGKLIGKGKVGPLPRPPRPLVLAAGDPLILTREPLPGQPAILDGGFLRCPARIACTLSEAFAAVRAGERIAFDPGEIGGVIESADGDELKVRITRARDGGSRLEAATPIHLPDSALELPDAFLAHEQALDFAAGEADAVILPFAERERSVRTLGEALDRRGAKKAGVVLAVATRRGVAALDRLLDAAFSRAPGGVMIDGGRLAVEYGPALLGRALDQIRRLAAAAGAPIICSEPFFDRGHRRSKPSRAEIRDAVAAARGQCLALDGELGDADTLRRFDRALRDA